MNDADVTNSQSSLIAPPTGGVAIAAGDDLSGKPIRGFQVDGTGNVAVKFIDSTQDQYTACQPGTIYPGIIVMVLANGVDSKGNAIATTATGIRGRY